MLRHAALLLLAPFVLALLVLACGGDDSPASPAPADTPAVDVTARADTAGADSAAGATILTLSADLPSAAPAGEALTVGVDLMAGATPVAGVTIESLVHAGGGQASAAVTDSAGHAEVTWTLGVVPVDQRLTLTAAEAAPLEALVRAERAAPLQSEPFGGVAGFLADAGIEASTEDLVFVGDHVVLGAPGGLLRLTAAEDISWIPLTGDPVERGWGIAADAEGTLWLVDADAQTLLRVSPEGEVTTVLTTDGEQPFQGLNDVEVGPDGRVYASDPCLGRLIRYDPLAGAIDATHDFDLLTEGGPNGFAWDAEGRMYVTTENTMILCPSSPVTEFDAPLASIYRIEVSEAGFGEREAIAEGLGVFGDGVTFDEDGNLYAIIDTLEGLGLDESAVVVLPNAEGPPQQVVVADGVIYANLAFGRGDFGERTLYLALLQVAVISGPESRGLQRVALGIRGAQ